MTLLTIKVPRLKNRVNVFTCSLPFQASTDTMQDEMEEVEEMELVGGELAAPADDDGGITAALREATLRTSAAVRAPPAPRSLNSHH